MSERNTIISSVGTPYTSVEDKAATANIYPGMLLKELSTGLSEHTTAGGPAQCIIAREDMSKGEEIGTIYTIAEEVNAAILPSGTPFLGILANGESVVKGDFLESNGDGKFRKVVVDSSAATIQVGSIIAIARETLDLSGSAGATLAEQRLLCRAK